MSIIPINLSGTVAADPQSRTLPSGRACASFRLAVNHWRLDKGTGEYVSDTTSWFSVDCYGPLASNASMSLHQGMSVVVQGTLKIREWSTAEKRGISPTVVAEHIGPDLRYGTANYQKVGSVNRQHDGQAQESSGSDSVWGSLGGAGAGDVGPDASEASSLGVGNEGEGDSEGAGDDVTADAAGGDSGDLDDAIARDTVSAAAPF
ncbi:single-stranded DNA-binding protein [Brevibacterium sp. UCMA 11754]|uniref:single-stranded DNA-binding protein n=1 Tax=Brevibacterium sp. UCMA 11754 TaxID=2749198 RepID=UPI001F428C5F|nr:single-stranded DNA-binding protein [Brevibacterium sp. UCMA 11754]MCF2574496.1 single-stranded DNA-binding protein [Brevibacterium sp. UCMA 11754]